MKEKFILFRSMPPHLVILREAEGEEVESLIVQLTFFPGRSLSVTL